MTKRPHPRMAEYRSAVALNPIVGKLTFTDWLDQMESYEAGIAERTVGEEEKAERRAGLWGAGC